MRDDETSSTPEIRGARPERPGLVLKAFLAAAAAGTAIGLALPAPHKPPPTRSQFATFEVGRG